MALSAAALIASGAATGASPSICTKDRRLRFMFIDLYLDAFGPSALFIPQHIFDGFAKISHDLVRKGAVAVVV